MEDNVRIGEAARQLGVSAQYLRVLEHQGIIPPARRDHDGRIFTAFDIELLRRIGVGSRPRKLKRVEEVLRTGG